MEIKIKNKTCRNPDCKKSFRPYSSFDKYCSWECQKKSEKKKIPKKSKAIPKISKKQSDMLLKYKKIRNEFLSRPENKYCPVTGMRATEVHHKMGKIGYADEWAREFDVPLLIDERYFLAVSRTGHNRIELNPEWAKENNYSETRNH